MPQISPKAFFFDFDGVIVDSEQVHMAAARAASETYGVTFTRDYYYEILLGFDDVGLFHHLWKQERNTLDEKTLKDLISKKNQAFMQKMKHEMVFFEGVVDLIKLLHKKNIPLAVVSGALRKEIQLCLDAGELGTYFDIIISANDVKKSKPDPECYIAAYEHMKKKNSHLETSDCWVIEDSPAGIEAAKKAHLNVIGITNSVFAEALSGADLIVSNYKDILLES